MNLVEKNSEKRATAETLIDENCGRSAHPAMVDDIPAAANAMEVSRSVLSCPCSALGRLEATEGNLCDDTSSHESLPSVQVHMTCGSYVRYSQGSKGPGIGV